VDKTSFPKDQIKVLLLENIHPLAKEMFIGEGFQVETMADALNPAQLREKLKDVHVLGIRSKTQVTAEAVADAKRLLTIGCFCIGTNQVQLEVMKKRGIPVFNAPFGNTRSVAEMIMAEIIMLARQLGQRNIEMHSKTWKKTSTGCYEVRGKVLGIVGYGNIGTQVSYLAESLGMKIIYFDVLPKLPHSNAKPCSSLNELLKTSDFVTLHVPATPQTHQMISHAELKAMKKGSFLLNASRGSVVDIAALAVSLKEKHLAGAAIDVFPEEPEGNTQSWATELQTIPNVILTPHIGGATEEAQVTIGGEVPTSLIRFVNSGSTIGAVNFPMLDVPHTKKSHRILNVHQNVSGVLKEINRIVSELGGNILAQGLTTDPEIGYLILDTDQALSQNVKKEIEALKTSIKTRMLY
jgi:D-3-phosphoglycerate dehydrogenase